MNKTKMEGLLLGEVEIKSEKSEQVTDLEANQEESCDPVIEIKEEPLDIKTEHCENDEIISQIHELDEIQDFVEEDHRDVGNISEGKRSSGSGDKQVGERDWQGFTCKDCDFIFETEDGLRNHLEALCDECSRCIFYCDCESNLIHKKVESFNCPECSYECNQKRDLKEHMIQHQRFKCPLCSYECRRKASLKVHMKIHELHKCPECDYECKLKVSLKVHMKIHVLLKCPKCDYTCDEQSLKSHILKHYNTTVYKCFDCSFECSNAKSLSDHKKSHRVKVWKCTEFDCDFRCIDKKYMEKHLLNHPVD